MIKWVLAIPVIFGILGALLVTMYFTNFQKAEDDFTVSELLQFASPPITNRQASLLIAEFGDYQCTFCYKFHQSSFNTIYDEYIKTAKAKMVFIDFPLNGPDSVLAAQAAHCANEQNAFWEYHNQIYNNWRGERTGWINYDSLNQFAKNIGINSDLFKECLDSKKYEDVVLDTYEFGKKIGISATPSFLIISGNKIIKITGNQPVEVFRKAIDSLQS